MMHCELMITHATTMTHVIMMNTCPITGGLIINTRILEGLSLLQSIPTDYFHRIGVSTTLNPKPPHDPHHHDPPP